jgi:hypothetical protein
MNPSPDTQILDIYGHGFDIAPDWRFVQPSTGKSSVNAQFAPNHDQNITPTDITLHITVTNSIAGYWDAQVVDGNGQVAATYPNCLYVFTQTQ